MIKKQILILILFISCVLINAQTPLIIQGQNIVNNDPEWDGYSILHNVKTSLTFKNNSITSINTSMYMLQAGDDYQATTINNLDNAIITGNKLTWNGVQTGNIITHGLFVGYNINQIIKWNYIINVPYGIIFKSGAYGSSNMNITSGGASYNIIKNGRFAVRAKGINGMRVYNNTFYGDVNSRYLILIYENSDGEPAYPGNPSINAKIKNNIFYTTTKTSSISIDNGSLSGFECDYNIYWCEEGDHNPVFLIDGDLHTWAEWRSHGYDKNSIIINPNFNNITDFVPSSKSIIQHGTNLGSEFQTGLSTTATWVVGSDPKFQDQNGTWQIGARIFVSDVVPPIYSGPYFVSPTGNDVSGDGSITKSWYTLNKAWTVIKAGDIIYMRGGSYNYSTTQTLTNKNGTSTNLIKILAYESELPIINAPPTFAYQNGLSIVNCSYVHIKGIEITGFVQKLGDRWYNGIWTEDVNNCIFEKLNIHHNCFGMSLSDANGTCSNNLILNCDFHHNSDPNTSIPGYEDLFPYGNADGLTIRINSSNSTSNVIRGCRMYYNSDDGVDLWSNEGLIEIDNCWAFLNGYFYDTMTPNGGDGNGFKLGRTYITNTSTILRKVHNCIAFNNPGWGFLRNGANCNMEIYNNTAFNNGNVNTSWSGGFFFGIDGEGISIPFYVKNNVAYKNNVNYQVIPITNMNHNSWDLPITTTDADFLSLNILEAMGPRTANGSLPNINFLKLVEGSDLIDRGISVGIAYKGNEPDLGAYESNYSFTPPIIIIYKPTVTTNSISSITQTSAVSGGNVTFDGNTSIIERGVCWNINEFPTIANNKTNNGTGTGIFSSNIIELLPNTIYFVRAYATNSLGTSYGSDIMFRTLSEEDVDPEIEPSLLIYPNPVNKYSPINIIIKNFIPIKIEIYNFFGKLIYSKSFDINNNLNNEYNYMLNLTQGIYIIKIQNEIGQLLIGELVVI